MQAARSNPNPKPGPDPKPNLLQVGHAFFEPPDLVEIESYDVAALHAALLIASNLPSGEGEGEGER